MELYIYIKKELNGKKVDYPSVRDKYKDKDVFGSSIKWGPNADIDYHGLKGKDSGYTYIPSILTQKQLDDLLKKNHGRYPSFNPTENKPDYFAPERVLSKLCCCRKGDAPKTQAQ
jgi:hypothetical protein